jgi:hypothetical protein
LALLGILFSAYAFSRSRIVADQPSKDDAKPERPQWSSAQEGPALNQPTLISTLQAPTRVDESNRETPSWKKILEIAAAVIGVGLLVVNIFQMIATQKAAETARDTFRLTYRPRLKILGLTQDQAMVDGKVQTNLDKGRLRVRIDVPNTGPFPARNVRFFRYDDVSTLDHIMKHRYGDELLGEPKLIPPRADGGWSSEMTITGEKALAPEEVAGLQRGTLYATFSILIAYDDDFGETHHAEYCGLFTLQPYNDICPWSVRND